MTDDHMNAFSNVVKMKFRECINPDALLKSHKLNAQQFHNRIPIYTCSARYFDLLATLRRSSSLPYLTLKPFSGFDFSRRLGGFQTFTSSHLLCKLIHELPPLLSFPPVHTLSCYFARRFGNGPPPGVYTRTAHSLLRSCPYNLLCAVCFSRYSALSRLSRFHGRPTC